MRRPILLPASIKGGGFGFRYCSSAKKTALPKVWMPLGALAGVGSVNSSNPGLTTPGTDVTVGVTFVFCGSNFVVCGVIGTLVTGTLKTCGVTRVDVPGIDPSKCSILF